VESGVDKVGLCTGHRSRKPDTANCGSNWLRRKLDQSCGSADNPNFVPNVVEALWCTGHCNASSVKALSNWSNFFVAMLEGVWSSRGLRFFDKFRGDNSKTMPGKALNRNKMIICFNIGAGIVN
jgi:hypothetical protein